MLALLLLKKVFKKFCSGFVIVL